MAVDFSLYINAIIETLFMTFTSSLLSYLIGIPLGILLYISAKDGLTPNRFLFFLLSLIVNLLRSIPFLILLILVLPITKFLVGSTIGPKAVIPPLVISASPYIARMVESSLNEVPSGIIEAANSMGASPLFIIVHFILPEAFPSLLLGAAINIATVLGYSAMAGVIGGGGLGAIALQYGYYRYEKTVLWVTVSILVIMVMLIQEAGVLLSKRSRKA